MIYTYSPAKSQVCTRIMPFQVYFHAHFFIHKNLFFRQKSYLERHQRLFVQ
jgi:hypothetical protein